MSESSALLAEAAARIFGELRTRAVSEAAERGEWPQALWDAVEQAGLSAAACSEARGGAGAGFAELAALLRTAGAHAVPLPVAETLLAEQMLAASGLAPRDGALGVGPVLSGDRLVATRQAGGWVLSGTLHRVPWGRDVRALVAVADVAGEPMTVVVERPPVTRRDRNYAFEPRDDLRLDGCVVPAHAAGRPGTGFDREDVYFRGALLRSLLMAGALQKVLGLTVDYAQQRVAFGRPIAKFQAVQQQIAVLATEAAAASGAAQAAVDAVGNAHARFVVASAKARVGEAAGIGAAIAHQVHAAIGFTHEHPLHLYTRRLWSWRDEFGGESEWFAWVGREAARVGGEGLWAHVTEAARRDRGRTPEDESGESGSDPGEERQ